MSSASTYVIGVWGKILTPGEAQTHHAGLYDVRITHATLGDSPSKGKDKGRTKVYITYSNEFSTGNSSAATDEERVMLTALSPQKVDHASLDITLPCGQSFVLEATGPSTVHLSGNYIHVDQASADVVSEQQSIEVPVAAFGPPAGKKRARADSESSGSQTPVPTLPVASTTSATGASVKKQKTQILAKPSRTNLGLLAKQYMHYESSASDAHTDGSVSERASVSSAHASGTTDDVETASHASTNSLTESRYGFKDTVPGTGNVKAQMGDVVHLRYIMCLRDGTVVVSQKDNPVALRLGDNDILPIVDKGLVGVRVDTERIISIPPEMGFGDKKHGKIPPNSALFFQCKIVRIVPA